MAFVQEFREFAVKGNAIDMAVGIMIGAAFNKIVNSMVEDIIMPPIGLLLAGVNFENLFIPLKSTTAQTVSEAKAAAVPTINYGLFINSTLSFVITAFALFLLVRFMNRLRRSKAEKAPGV